MAKSVSTHQRGFTLIEMSIVLVIIGLIIGGILKGQELIESSRQKNLISQIDHLRAAKNTFVDRFRSLPGDMQNVAHLPNNALLSSLGNDNGIIGADQSTTPWTLAPSQTGTNENVQFWNQLIAADMTNGAVTSANPGCFAGLCQTSSPMPQSAFPQSGLSIVYGTHPGGSAPGPASSLQGHWFNLSRWSTTTLVTANGVVSPARAFQIDSKYDDGFAAAGNIRTAVTTADCGSASADYAPTVTVVECAMMFTLD